MNSFKIFPLNHSKIATLFVIAFLLQGLLFFNYMNREVAFDFILHGDPTWYIYFNYKLFNAYIENNWNVFWEMAKTSPWGMLLFIETTFLQLIFGPSRASVSSINLVYYFLAQIATFVFFYKWHNRKSAGIIAVILLLALTSPFRKDGPGLNISDFHFDLVFFFMLLVLHYMAAASKMFRHRGWAIALGVFAGLIVASRIVSFFLIATIFGVYGIYLLVCWLRSKANGELKNILQNYFYAACSFIALAAIPLWIARKAVYAHYFRFIFDRKFIEDRAGLYTFGSSKSEEAAQLLYRMVKFDFGGPFFWAFAIIISAAIIGGGIGWRKGNRKSTGENIRSLAAEKREFYIFLALSAISSFILHLSFPIKSDHLTRMTAAPLFIALAIWVSWFLTESYDSKRKWLRFISTGGIAGLAFAAVYVQTGFYFGMGRHHLNKSDSLVLQELYSDISKISSNRGLKTVAISTDRVETYELGALMSFFTYEYEKNGIIRIQNPKLGGVLDEPINFEDALSQVKQSDFVLLGDLPYNTINTPLNRSLKARIGELHDFTNRELCRYKDYFLFDKHKVLYLKQEKMWSYAASSSTESKYGPEGLIEGTGNIWHAPWKAGESQWVEFSSQYDIEMHSITIYPQFGGADRAPKDFKLQALRGRDWVDLLSVRNAAYVEDQAKTWEVMQGAPYKSFRVLVTRNNGNPSLMTIRKLDIGISNLPKRCKSF